MTFRKLAAWTMPAGLLLGALVASPGCSKQNEGERCDLSGSGDSGCEGGLQCISAEDLVASDGADRCCPASADAAEDERCRRSALGGGGGNMAGAGNGGSAGATSGGAGTGAASAGGTKSGDACSYDSQCPTGQRCGPTGVCQPECLGDRDCPEGEICNVATQVCEATQGGSSGAAGASN